MPYKGETSNGSWGDVVYTSVPRRSDPLLTALEVAHDRARAKRRVERMRKRRKSVQYREGHCRRCDKQVKAGEKVYACCPTHTPFSLTLYLQPWVCSTCAHALHPEGL